MTITTVTTHPGYQECAHTRFKKKKQLLHFHKPLISSSSGGVEVNLLTRNHTVPCFNIL